MSFNGGKDCTVMLDLFSRIAKRPFLACCVVCEESFPEVESFVDECPARYSSRSGSNQRYPVELVRYRGDLKTAFARFLLSYPNIKAIMIGVRRSDPHCEHLQELEQTDNGWPVFMRLHPILEWSYADVWQYIRSRGIPYCPLYDRGYTSIGPVSLTVPNPHLKALGNSYEPAHKLADESLERAGRKTQG